MAFALSFCSITYELIFANTLSLLTGSYVWWHSWTIGFYVMGLGLGAVLSGKLLNSFKELFFIEILLSLIGALSVLYIFIIHLIFRSGDYMSYLGGEFYSASYIQVSFYMKIFFFFLVQMVTLLVGTLSGFEVPLLIKILKEKTGKDQENTILGISYIGTLFGTLVFSFILLPKVDILYASVLIASFNLLICFYLLFKKRVQKTFIYLSSFVIVFIVLILVGKYEDRIQQNYLKIRYLSDRIIAKDKSQLAYFLNNLDKVPDILRVKSLYQHIDIFNIKRVDQEDETIMALDGHFQFSTETERLYHEGFSHASLSLMGLFPKNVLVLGGGDGLLIRELLKYPEIEKIDQVELDAKVLELAKTKPFLKKINKDSLKDSRVKTMIGDGFYYVRNNKKKYDAIFIDFPYPRNYNLARLYSFEFYKYVKNNLSKNGFVVLDVPMVEKKIYKNRKFQGRILDKMLFSSADKYNNSVIMSTVYFSGFKKILPYKVGEESFLILHNLDKKFEYENLESRLSKYEKVKMKDLFSIPRQYFPYEIKKKYVNSIFAPTIMGLSDF